MAIDETCAVAALFARHSVHFLLRVDDTQIVIIVALPKILMNYTIYVTFS
jgi:hypothetical protein